MSAKKKICKIRGTINYCFFVIIIIIIIKIIVIRNNLLVDRPIMVKFILLVSEH